MDSEGFRGSEKREIDNAVYLACTFPHADSSKYLGFLAPDLCRVLRAKASRAEFASRGIRYHMPASSIGMPFGHVLFWSNPLQIVGRIVGFDAIAMVDKFGILNWLKPADSDKTMDKAIFPGLYISVRAKLGSIGKHFLTCLSKNFPAPRNSVTAVKDSVFDAVVDVCAQHGRLFMRVIGCYSLPEKQRKV